MRIVFMGTPDFAAGILKALIQSPWEIVGVVTQPDKPKGRKGTPVPGPVSDLALAENLPLFQPDKVRKSEHIETIRAMEPDVIIVAAFGQILPKALLDIPRFGCLNVHASLLPAWRGASPIQHAILAGDTVSGVTIMRMNEGLDTGDIISSREVPIGEDMNAGDLFDALMETGAALLTDTLPSVFDGTAVYTKQPEESTTPYASMIRREDGHIKWTESADFISRMVRAYSPWPSAFTSLDGKNLKIWRATAEPWSGENTLPGTVHVRGEELTVQTGEGLLRIEELQLEGKKRMDAAAFLRGSHPDGKVLG